MSGAAEVTAGLSDCGNDGLFITVMAVFFLFIIILIQQHLVTFLLAKCIRLLWDAALMAKWKEGFTVTTLKLLKFANWSHGMSAFAE